MSCNTFVKTTNCVVCNKKISKSVSKIFDLCSRDCLIRKINILEIDMSTIFVKNLFSSSSDYGDFLKRITDCSDRHNYDFYACYKKVFEIQKKLNIDNRGFNNG